MQNLNWDLKLLINYAMRINSLCDQKKNEKQTVFKYFFWTLLRFHTFIKVVLCVKHWKKWMKMHFSFRVAVKNMLSLAVMNVKAYFNAKQTTETW